MTQSWDAFPAAAPRSPQPVIPREAAPQTGDQAEHQRLENANLRQTIEQNAERLDPAAIDLYAHKYLADGTMPAFGMGRAGAGNRTAILNRVASIVGANGGTGAGMATAISRYRNGVHALQTLETQLGTISGNEQSARGYAEQALSAIRALVPDNSWSPTNLVRNIIGDTTNDPNLGAWDSARNTFLTEYGKVVAGSPSGAGVLSDSARQEQMSVLRRTTNPQQAEAIIQQMQRDMDIRHSSLQANIQAGYQNLEAGRPVSFNSRGEALDERGNVVPPPAAGGSARRDDSAPPALPSPLSGGPPAPPGGGQLDRTRLSAGNQPEDMSVSHTGDTNQIVDNSPIIEGVRHHLSAMIADRNVTNEQIRSYLQGVGNDYSHSPEYQRGLEQVLTFRDTPGMENWRQQHPNQGYPVDPQRITRPLTTTESIANSVADTAPGTALITGENIVTGQNLPSIAGALGGNEDRTRAGIEELRSRHPYGALAGDVLGSVELYNGVTGGARVGLNAAERVAPSLFARLPAWVRAGTTAADAEAAAAPYSGEAASQRLMSPNATFAPRAVATDAAIGAYESPGNRIEGGVVGGLTGVGTRGAINTVARAASPTGGALAPAYEENVQPSLGQRLGAVERPTSAADIGGWAAYGLGRGFNRMEQAFQSIPGVGMIQRSSRSAAQDQWQLGGFNRALRNLPDEPQLPAGTAPGTAPHAFTQKAFDDAYTRVHQRINVVPDEQLNQELEAIRQDATSNLSDSGLSHFNRVVDNSVLRRLTVPGQPVTGSDLQDMLSEVRRVARAQRSSATGDRELASSLDDVAQTIYDNAARYSAPEAMQTLNGINRGYGMLVRIENAANRAGAGEPGEYTARGLVNADRTQGGLRGRQFLAGNGLMTDYARAGMKLGDTVSDSGTGERLATLGGTALAAHSVSPYAALPWVVDTAANLPGVRQALNWALKPNRASIRPYTDELRATLQQHAGIGSTLGVPSVVAAYNDRPDY